MFVAGIVITKFSDNLWFVLPALGAAAVYGVWQAPTTAHGPLLQRWLTPILVLAYTAFLVVVAVDPDLPPVWEVTVPAVLFAVTAFAAARSYGATGILLAVGIAVIGAGIALILHQDLGGGIAVIGGGIALILHQALAVGIADIGFGIAAIGAGIWILRASAVGGGIEAVVGGTEAGAGTGPPAGVVAAADPPPPVGAEGRVGRHARPD